MLAPTLGKDQSGRLLAVVLTALVGSFLLTTWIVQRSSMDVETLSARMVEQTMPRIERLAAARAAALEVELAISAYIEQDAPSRARAAQALDTWLARLDEDLAWHLGRVPLPGELPLWGQLQAALIHFRGAVRAARDLADEGRRADAKAAFLHRVLPAGVELSEIAMRDVELSAHHGRELAVQIRRSRRDAVTRSYLLTGFCIVLGVVGGTLIVRQGRRRQALVNQHARFLVARGDELEQFAGRVAHDIRGPLSAAMMSSELIDGRTDDAAIRSNAARIRRGLERTLEITDGLLGFARAGARPDPGARTNVAEVIGDLAAGLGPEVERARVELRVAPAPSVLVACSTGVYLSILGNLVRNAIKYMGDGTTRRITVRVTAGQATVRTEVSDTGPGIPAASLPSLFEPYVRGPHRHQAGLGLGLATVKKLVDGHDGQVGVRSKTGEGSTFWFELPRASGVWDGHEDPV